MVYLQKTHKAVSLFYFHCFLDTLGIPLLLGDFLDLGIFVVFFFLFFTCSFVLSVNALLTLLMPYVSGLVLLDRSHTHTHLGVANSLVRY